MGIKIHSLGYVVVQYWLDGWRGACCSSFVPSSIRFLFPGPQTPKAICPHLQPLTHTFAMLTHLKSLLRPRELNQDWRQTTSILKQSTVNRNHVMPCRPLKTFPPLPLDWLQTRISGPALQSLPWRGSSSLCPLLSLIVELVVPLINAANCSHWLGRHISICVVFLIFLCHFYSEHQTVHLRLMKVDVTFFSRLAYTFLLEAVEALDLLATDLRKVVPARGCLTLKPRNASSRRRNRWGSGTAGVAYNLPATAASTSIIYFLSKILSNNTERRLSIQYSNRFSGFRLIQAIPTRHTGALQIGLLRCHAESCFRIL